MAGEGGGEGFEVTGAVAGRVGIGDVLRQHLLTVLQIRQTPVGEVEQTAVATCQARPAVSHCIRSARWEYRVLGGGG